jgi:hypothetical protein
VAGLLENDEKLRNHDERIVVLEEGQSVLKKESDDLFLWKKETERRLQQGEHNYQDLKNTILVANDRMQTFFSSTMDKQWDLIKSRDALSENENIRKHDFSKSKLEKWSEIVIKVCGAGGILIVIAQLLFGK